MTTDITELALIDKIQKQLENFDTVVLKEDEANALVEALEKAQQVDEELCKLLPPGAEYMDPPDGGDVTPLEGVRRMVADYRQRIAEPGQHRGGDRFDEIRRGVGDHRRAVRTAGVHRLERYFRQRFTGQG